MTKIQKVKTIILLANFMLFFATPIFAAQVNFSSDSQNIRVGGQFEVGVFLNTDSEDINAVEGKIVFPKKLLELKEIRDGNSIINFWIERPGKRQATSDIQQGEIIFSGIIPGGYMDKKGLIFSIIFQAAQEGQGSVEIRDIKVLLNDGKGTETNTAISNLQFVISEQAPAPQPAAVEKKDTDMPEAFEPIVASDPAIFGGKYFLVFTAQDKGSGIDYYEVCEAGKKCITVESPYLLQNQNIDKEIAVKAVDKSGNKRVAIIPAQKLRAWYKNYAIIAILMIVAFMYLIWEILWKKLRK
jgi:hypothetical protein